VDPTQYRTPLKRFLRRLTKKGDIPSINLLVDIGNLVSIRYGLPVAVFERRTLQGVVTVHFADGSERYSELGESDEDPPKPGEVIFSDEAKLVVARRWCWRQSEPSAAVASNPRMRDYHRGAPRHRPPTTSRPRCTICLIYSKNMSWRPKWLRYTSSNIFFE